MCHVGIVSEGIGVPVHAHVRMSDILVSCNGSRVDCRKKWRGKESGFLCKQKGVKGLRRGGGEMMEQLTQAEDSGTSMLMEPVKSSQEVVVYFFSISKKTMVYTQAYLSAGR